MDLGNLYKIKEFFESCDDKNSCKEEKEDTKSDKIQELEDKIAAIDKKETRGFISEDKADEERDELRKKLKAIKERVEK